MTEKDNVRWATWSLRIALAFVFTYAGISGIAMPDSWIGFIPSYVPLALAKPSLDLFSVVQLILAAWLLWGRWLRYAAAASAVLIASLTIANLSSLIVTFRDIGLALAAVALLLLAE